MADSVTDAQTRRRLTEIQERLRGGLEKVDPHRHLTGRPASYNVISGRTVEVTFRDVPRIDEAEVLGVKRLIGEECFCSVSPETAETLTVRFIVPLMVI